MSTQTAARTAGAMFLVVMAAVLASSSLQGEPEGSVGATLAAIADNELTYRVGTVTLLMAAVASLVLGASLYAVTRREDRDLATFALACRIAESGAYIVQIVGALALLSLSTMAEADEQLATLVSELASWGINIGATFFAVSSTVYAYLLLRGRMIPSVFCVVGVVGSLILVVGVPWETAAGRTTAEGSSMMLWLPMFVFEIGAGLWLLVKGARTPVSRTRAADIV